MGWPIAGAVRCVGEAAFASGEFGVDGVGEFAGPGGGGFVCSGDVAVSGERAGDVAGVGGASAGA